MKISKIKLANYKLSQEIWNAISHGLGALFGVVVLILLLMKVNGYFPSKEVVYDTQYIIDTVAACFYGLSIIICMSISCIYHALAKNNGKKVMRVIDHAMVYLLVAGSYSAICLVGLNDMPLWNIPNTNWGGYFILGISLTCLIVGVVFSSINLFKFSKLSMVMYLVGGGIILIDPVGVYNALTINGFLLLVFGGVAFFMGAALYGIGKKKSLWYHTVFHFFVLLGIVLHFLAIYFYVY